MGFKLTKINIKCTNTSVNTCTKCIRAIKLTAAQKYILIVIYTHLFYYQFILFSALSGYSKYLILIIKILLFPPPPPVIRTHKNRFWTRPKPFTHHTSLIDLKINVSCKDELNTKNEILHYTLKIKIFLLV